MPDTAAPAHPLIRRAQAAESTVGKFSGEPLAWGRKDCLRMIAHTLRALGHAPPLRDAGPYGSLLGAHRALKRTGFATLTDWVDSWGLTRIPPAMALPADVLAFASGDDAMPALALQLSNARILGFVPELGRCAAVHVREGVAPLAAWSV